MPAKDDRNEERLSRNLAHYIVSPAVLNSFDETPEKAADGKAGARKAATKASTIVELNIEFSPDIAEAKDAAVALLTDAKIARKRIDDKSSDYNLFIDLTRGELAAIEKAVQAARPSPIFRIWPDPDLTPLIHRSVRTIKADACFTVYKSSGAEIVWAVADSGVDATHFHFQRHQTTTLPGTLKHRDFTLTSEDGTTDDEATALVDDYGHGTHVAGIIAGETRLLDPLEAEDFSRGDLPEGHTDRGKKLLRLSSRQVTETQESDKTRIETEIDSLPGALTGVAPLAKIMSLKVLDKKGGGKTRHLIAALEYVEKINSHGRLIRVHGINLSVGYTFDAEQYAAGHSPLCTAVNRLVRSGVVVVAAAGNDGAALIAPEGSARSKRIGLGQSINDPGNAEEAITVGATHGEEPHRYGISYFSSRGPTADGRMKPDLVAPGERILSCVPRQSAKAANLVDPLKDGSKPPEDAYLYRTLSGTSMAAPHVSGSIAALMSVRREFRGEAQKVKDIFVNSCTDLRRSRDFQGAGLIDLMRAIQSI